MPIRSDLREGRQLFAENDVGRRAIANHADYDPVAPAVVVQVRERHGHGDRSTISADGIT